MYACDVVFKRKDDLISCFGCVLDRQAKKRLFTTKDQSRSLSCVQTFLLILSKNGRKRNVHLNLVIVAGAGIEICDFLGGWI